ncbi:MAG: glucokinase [Candidatus Binatia bacterium]
MAPREVILGGDIGGTKTNLALYSVQGDKLTPVVKEKFASRNYSSLEPILQEFLLRNTTPTRSACFGVAGPVIDGRCQTPNLPWILDVRELSRSLDLDSVALINDLEATAYGILTLDAQQFEVLNKGRSQPEGNMALIAAGTGLGEAFFFWDGNDYHPSSSEGGHVDFGPRTPLESELLRYLMPRFDHVSYERLVSGPGLLNIYNFLKETGRLTEPPWLKARLVKGDSCAIISEVALREEAEICVKALDLFVSLYGAEAGNLALKAKAVGGFYVGGGIAPKILKKLKGGLFMQAFIDKGRFSGLLSDIPVRVVLNEEAALEGAAYYAALRSERPVQ